jgi:hypothetical protein
MTVVLKKACLMDVEKLTFVTTHQVTIYSKFKMLQHNLHWFSSLPPLHNWTYCFVSYVNAIKCRADMNHVQLTRTLRMPSVRDYQIVCSFA